MSRFRYRLAMAIARLLGFKPFYNIAPCSEQPIWARTREEAVHEEAMLALGESTSRLLPNWIKKIRGWD